MKTLAIGDIHGRDTWKEIVKNDHDRVIFVGDYFDSFSIPTIVQLHNFKEIIDYKINSGKEVILLRGNHDCHYLWNWPEQYSGFQKLKCLDIREALESNKEHFQMAHIQDGTIFTHAGVTKQWLKNNDLIEDDKLDETINNLFIQNPDAFLFDGYDEYGDNITQSPIWVRPRSLVKDTIDMIQVFGHTSVKEITALHMNEDRNRFYPIDALGTSRQYLLIEDGLITIKAL